MRFFFVPIMAITLLFSTIGVGINSMYCHCMDTMEKSIFNLEDPCKKNDFTCCSSISTEDITGCCTENDCGSSDQELVKLEVDFLVAEKEFHDLKIPALNTTTYLFSNVQILLKTGWASGFQNKAPPHWFGKHIVKYLHAYRC